MKELMTDVDVAWIRNRAIDACRAYRDGDLSRSLRCLEDIQTSVEHIVKWITDARELHGECDSWK